MSRSLLEEHRRIWERKPVLADVYRVWFDLLLAAFPTRGSVVEVGAGPGFLSRYAAQAAPGLRWVGTELIPTPWNELVADGLRLPVRAAALEGVAGLDLVHHLARPAAFFREAARVLKPGGTVAVVEPWVTPFSFPIYRWLHQEGCRPSLDPWDPFGVGDAGAKDAFEGDAAVVWKLVRDTAEARWAELGFAAPRVRRLNGFAYLLSLGFKERSLLPRGLAPLLFLLDDALAPAAAWLGMRALVVWERSG